MTLRVKAYCVAAALAILLADTTAAIAQDRLVGVTPTVGGEVVRCTDGIRPIVTLERQGLNDIAIAQPGQIIVNPLFWTLSGALQLFIYGHECGHHVVGLDEARADCWSIQTGRKQGWFTADDIHDVQEYFGQSRGDWTHAPGPIRVGRLIKCFDAAGDRDQTMASDSPRVTRRKPQTTDDNSASREGNRLESRPSADKDSALNALVDAIADLPVQETRINGEQRQTHRHKVQLVRDCVLELTTYHETIRDGTTWTVTQVVPLANLTMEVTPHNGSSALVFHSTRRDMQIRISGLNDDKPEPQDRASLTFTTTEDARRVRDMAQSAIRACGRG